MNAGGKEEGGGERGKREKMIIPANINHPYLPRPSAWRPRRGEKQKKWKRGEKREHRSHFAKEKN